MRRQRTRPRRRLSQETIRKKDGLIQLILWRRDWRLTKIGMTLLGLLWLCAWSRL